MLKIGHLMTDFRQFGDGVEKLTGVISHITDEMLVIILESLSEGVHVVNAEGITIFYNQIAANLDGLMVQEVMGMHVLEVFPSLTPKTSTLLNVLENGEEIKKEQQSFMNRKGKKVATSNRTLPLYDGGQLVGAVEISKDITHMQELSEQVIHLQEQMREPQAKRKGKFLQFYRFADIITQNPQLLKEIERAKRASLTQSPVLVVGETGTGKELIVQAIHHDSPRRQQPFIAQNCAAIPSSLLEGILFGTAKGAFTGATDRPGLFELADGGTIFLDEIHAMPMDLQAKLLRLLEEGAVRRVGGTELVPVDVRIMVATNEDPMVSIAEGRLRRDLYYRVHVVGIQLPPLRERPEDIELLAHYFLRKMKGQFRTPVNVISSEVIQLFHRYEWPGNVRELEHTIEGALNLATGSMLTLEHLPSYFERSGQMAMKSETSGELTLREALNRVEVEMIQKAMRECADNVLQAANRLGIPRQTLQYKLKKLQGEN